VCITLPGATFEALERRARGEGVRPSTAARLLLEQVLATDQPADFVNL
jgi:hypothetical protein